MTLRSICRVATCKRFHKHPDPDVERILQELAKQGGDLNLIEEFARRAAEQPSFGQGAGHRQRPDGQALTTDGF